MKRKWHVTKRGKKWKRLIPDVNFLDDKDLYRLTFEFESLIKSLKLYMNMIVLHRKTTFKLQEYCRHIDRVWEI